MNEEGYQVTFKSIIERVSRLEKEVMEIREFLLPQTVQLAKPIDTSPYIPTKSHPSLGETGRTGSWEVLCFGSFHLICAGEDHAPCSSRRGQSVLKYLLTSPGYAASVEMLIDCFWPQMDFVAGAHNLQMAVHLLRRSLHGYGPEGGNDVILFRNNRYLLNPALSITLDVDAFRVSYKQGQRAAGEGRTAEAVQAFEKARDLYKGEFLANPYEEWASGQRIALQNMWLDLLNQLGTFYRQVRKWEQATTCYHQILTVDPYREDIYRHLMQCYALCGRLAEVQRIYLNCQECLHRDLHLNPALETTNLYRQLIRQAEPLDMN